MGVCRTFECGGSTQLRRILVADGRDGNLKAWSGVTFILNYTFDVFTSESTCEI